MDYSSIHEADPENATGADPWASSPRQTRASLDQSREPPTSPSSKFNDLPLPEPATPAKNVAQPDFSHRISATENGYHGSPDQPSRPIQSLPQQQQQLRGPHMSQQRYHANRPDSRQNLPNYKLQPKVTGLERPGRKDLILRFDIYTNLPGYRTTQFRDVRRTHAEFGKLADHLISANPEALVPALPPSSTPAGVGTDEDEARTKASMQRWLSVVCANEVLMRDDEMVRFIEGDPGYSPVIKRSQPATGVRRKVLKQFAPPPDDTPELQEARPIVKQFYLGAMDAGQKMDKSVKSRRGLGLAESDFGAKLGALAEQEGHPGLKNGFRRLGKTIQQIGDLHAAQGTGEATALGDPLTYHSNDAFIVKETLTNRHILLRDLIQAQQTTRSKLSATDRLKSSASVRRDKVDEAIAALEEARSHEAYLGQKTARVTANLLSERRRWFARTATDLRVSLREYVVRQIEAERRALATLEVVRPDVRAIDASGGLSRLGREGFPVSAAAARRVSALQSSQGPRGDAWSGVARRPDGLNRSVSGGYAGVIAAPPNGPVQRDDREVDEAEGSTGTGRERAASGTGSLTSVLEEDDDRIDAKNAASRLATSTF